MLRFIIHVLKEVRGVSSVLLGMPILLIFEYLSMAVLVIIGGGGKNLLDLNMGQFAIGDLRNLTYAQQFIVLLILILCRQIFGYNHNLNVVKISTNIQRYIIQTTFKHLIFSESIVKIGKKGAGHYITLIGDSATRASQFFIILMKIIDGIIAVIPLTYLIFNLSSQILYGIFIYVFISIVFVLKIYKKLSIYSNLELDENKKSSNVFVETVNSIRTVRTLESGGFLFDKYNQSLTDVLNYRVKIDDNKLLIRFIPAFLLILVSIFILFTDYGNGLADKPLEFLTLVILVMRFFSSIGSIGLSVANLYAEIASSKSILDVFDFLQHNINYEKKYNSIKNLDLKNISYEYIQNKKVLNNLSFTFVKNNSYAIIGKSGSGKSTLVDILSGISSPNAGEIFINNIRVSAGDLISNVSVVEQSCKFYAMSIRDNICLGLEVSDDELFEVLDLVMMKDYVLLQPFGLDSIINYQSTNISGGQLQRLAIARALIRRPKALILDESTSGLDEHTCKIVVQNLVRSKLVDILIFITHDLAIADQVDFVLDLNA